MGRAATRRPLDAERQSLAVAYLPLARSLARRMGNLYPGDPSEAESVAIEGLVLAASTFDRGRSPDFAGHARRRIVGALIDGRRRPMLHGDQDVPRDDPPSHAEAAELLERLMRGLAPEQAAVLRLVDLGGGTGEHAAAELGCSQSIVSLMRRRALEHCREKAATLGLT